MKDDHKETYIAAVEKFGITNQMVVAMEECSELTKELAKFLRNDGSLERLVDEVADAQIMIQQIMLFFNLENRVQEHIELKIERLSNRISSIQ